MNDACSSFDFTFHVNFYGIHEFEWSFLFSLHYQCALFFICNFIFPSYFRSSLIKQWVLLMKRQDKHRQEPTNTKCKIESQNEMKEYLLQCTFWSARCHESEREMPIAIAFLLEDFHWARRKSFFVLHSPSSLRDFIETMSITQSRISITYQNICLKYWIAWVEFNLSTKWPNIRWTANYSLNVIRAVRLIFNFRLFSYKNIFVRLIFSWDARKLNFLITNIPFSVFLSVFILVYFKW